MKRYTLIPLLDKAVPIPINIRKTEDYKFTS